MSKHLNHIEILKYRQAALPPQELLAADFHLETCAECRLKLRQNQELAILYQSFFEPLKGADEKEKTRFFKNKFKERWKKLSSMDFFSVGILLTNRRLQIAFAGLVFLIFGSFIFLSFNSNSKFNEIAVNQPLLTNKEIEKPQSVQAESKPDESEFNTVKSVTVSKISTKSEVTKRVSNSKRVSENIKKSERELVVNVTLLESDRSQTLTTDESAVEEKKPIEIGIETFKNRLGINFKTDEKVDEFEIFIAEIPEFKTVARVKTMNTEWSLPLQKLSRGKNYVLQITALKNGTPLQTVKRKINLSTALK